MRRKIQRWIDELSDPDVYSLSQELITIIARATAIIVGWIWYIR
jgi:hypothetical protein